MNGISPPSSSTYSLFGVTIRSDIPLPCQTTEQECEDITIRYGEVEEDLNTSQWSSSDGIFFQATPSQMLITVKGVAKYLIQDGRSIVVRPHEGSTEELVALFLMGPVLGGILHQRGLLVLHGSAVRIDQEAVVFLGASGVGKSTLAAGLMKRGYAIATDDLAVISPISAQIVIYPGTPRIKLWDDSCTQLGFALTDLVPVRQKANKYVVPLMNSFVKEPLAVKQVYIIEKSEQKSFVIMPLSGSDKLMALVNNTYRHEYLKDMGLVACHFELCLRVAEQVSVHRILRPDDDFILDLLISLVESDLKCGATE